NHNRIIFIMILLYNVMKRCYALGFGAALFLLLCKNEIDGGVNDLLYNRCIFNIIRSANKMVSSEKHGTRGKHSNYFRFPIHNITSESWCCMGNPRRTNVVILYHYHYCYRSYYLLLRETC